MLWGGSSVVDTMDVCDRLLADAILMCRENIEYTRVVRPPTLPSEAIQRSVHPLHHVQEQDNHDNKTLGCTSQQLVAEYLCLRVLETEKNSKGIQTVYFTALFSNNGASLARASSGFFNTTLLTHSDRLVIAGLVAQFGGAFSQQKENACTKLFSQRLLKSQADTWSIMDRVVLAGNDTPLFHQIFGLKKKDIAAGDKNSLTCLVKIIPVFAHGSTVPVKKTDRSYSQISPVTTTIILILCRLPNGCVYVGALPPEPKEGTAKDSPTAVAAYLAESLRRHNATSDQNIAGPLVESGSAPPPPGRHRKPQSTEFTGIDRFLARHGTFDDEQIDDSDKGGVLCCGGAERSNQKAGRSAGSFLETGAAVDLSIIHHNTPGLLRAHTARIHAAEISHTPFGYDTLRSTSVAEMNDSLPPSESSASLMAGGLENIIVMLHMCPSLKSQVKQRFHYDANLQKAQNAMHKCIGLNIEDTGLALADLPVAPPAILKTHQHVFSYVPHGHPLERVVSEDEEWAVEPAPVAAFFISGSISAGPRSAYACHLVGQSPSDRGLRSIQSTLRRPASAVMCPTGALDLTNHTIAPRQSAAYEEECLESGNMIATGCAMEELPSVLLHDIARETISADYERMKLIHKKVSKTKKAELLPAPDLTYLLSSAVDDEEEDNGAPAVMLRNTRLGSLQGGRQSLLKWGRTTATAIVTHYGGHGVAMEASRAVKSSYCWLAEIAWREGSALRAALQAILLHSSPANAQLQSYRNILVNRTCFSHQHYISDPDGSDSSHEDEDSEDQDTGDGFG